jgi:type VI secretion system protein ImpL
MLPIDADERCPPVATDCPDESLAWQGQTGQQSEGLSDSIIKSAKDLVGGKDKPIDQSASGPGAAGRYLWSAAGFWQKQRQQRHVGGQLPESADVSDPYHPRASALQQVASASDPQAMMQTLAQTVFQGKSVDLTDTSNTAA